MLALTHAALIIALASRGATDANCTREAQVVYQVTPYFPDPSEHLAHYLVLVRIMIEPTGAESGATILESSGYDSIDAAAIWAATKSTYKPAYVSCQPVKKMYVSSFEFGPPGGVAASVMNVPAFWPGGDWIASHDPAPALNVASLGYLIGSWKRPGETLGFAEYFTEGPGVSLDQGLSFARARLEQFDPTDETTRTTSLCNGKLAAEELNFQFSTQRLVGKDVVHQAAVFVTVRHSTIYAFGYSMPEDTPFDPAVPPEIAGFCG